MRVPQECTNRLAWGPHPWFEPIPANASDLPLKSKRLCIHCPICDSKVTRHDRHCPTSLDEYLCDLFPPEVDRFLQLLPRLDPNSRYPIQMTIAALARPRNRASTCRALATHFRQRHRSKCAFSWP